MRPSFRVGDRLTFGVEQESRLPTFLKPSDYDRGLYSKFRTLWKASVPVAVSPLRRETVGVE